MDKQCAKKVVSNSLRQVDFSIRVVNSVLNLPDRQMKCFEEFKLQNNYDKSCSIWQAVELTLFVP